MSCEPQFSVENISSYVLAVMGNRCQSEAIVVPTVIAYSLIFIIGTVGNICTCVVITRNRSMHTHTNFYLFSLALSDLVVLFLGLPMELYGVIDFAYPYQFSEWVCKGRAYLIEFTSYASILVICSFTVERWMAICHPLRSQSSPKVSRAYMTIMLMWTISAISALPMGFIVKINRLPLPEWALDQPWIETVSEDYMTVKDTQFCAMDVDQPEQQKRLIYFAFIAFFMVPAFLMTMMYCQIGARIAAKDSLLSVDKNEMRVKATHTAIRMLISVVVSFFLCWLPFHIQRLLSLFISYYEGNVSPAVETLFSLVYYISGCCYYSNSAMNPILYNLFSAKYRKAFCVTILGRRVAMKIRPQWFSARSKLRSIQDRSSRHFTSPNSSARFKLEKRPLCIKTNGNIVTTAMLV
ncbi:hypothetical protein V3C99_011787 [Haemonchus contortus]